MAPLPTTSVLFQNLEKVDKPRGELSTLKLAGLGEVAAEMRATAEEGIC